MNERYPVQLDARSVHTRFQAGFAKLATLLLPKTESVLYEPSSEGLRILAEHEDALQAAGQKLRDIFSDEVELGSPRPHLIYTDTLREPVMALTVSVPHVHLRSIRADLTRRGALVHTERARQSECEMGAQVRLAAVIGYRRDLETLTHGSGAVSMRLSHYETVGTSAASALRNSARSDSCPRAP